MPLVTLFGRARGNSAHMNHRERPLDGSSRRQRACTRRWNESLLDGADHVYYRSIEHHRWRHSVGPDGAGRVDCREIPQDVRPLNASKLLRAVSTSRQSPRCRPAGTWRAISNESSVSAASVWCGVGMSIAATERTISSAVSYGLPRGSERPGCAELEERE